MFLLSIWLDIEKCALTKLQKQQFFFSFLLYLSCSLRCWVNQISMLFRTFSLQLEDIDTFQCSSESFPHWSHISGCVQNCQIYILMHDCWEKAHNYGTDSGQIFRTFSPQLENNNTLKSSSDSFAHTLRYVVNVENCRNNIEMYQCPPIAGRRS